MWWTAKYGGYPGDGRGNGELECAYFTRTVYSAKNHDREQPKTLKMLRTLKTEGTRRAPALALRLAQSPVSDEQLTLTAGEVCVCGGVCVCRGGGG